MEGVFSDTLWGNSFGEPQSQASARESGSPDGQREAEIQNPCIVVSLPVMAQLLRSCTNRRRSLSSPRHSSNCAAAVPPLQIQACSPRWKGKIALLLAITREKKRTPPWGLSRASENDCARWWPPLKPAAHSLSLLPSPGLPEACAETASGPCQTYRNPCAFSKTPGDSCPP